MEHFEQLCSPRKKYYRLALSESLTWHGKWLMEVRDSHNIDIISIVTTTLGSHILDSHIILVVCVLFEIFGIITKFNVYALHSTAY